MESRLMISCFLLLILLVSLSSTGPVRSKTKCSSKCDESRNLLNYKKGYKYVYDFKNFITTHIPEGTREQVKVSISARAEFHIMDKCEITLTVKNAKMEEVVRSDGKQVTSKSFSMLPKLLEKYPVPFGFNDGRITGICNSEKENRKVLNVKKAMISQFQISMEQIVTPTSLTERDISGDCLTEYQYDKEKGDIVHINKMKAILGCANRKVSYSDLRGQNFFKPTENSQMPLLNGHQKCYLEVSRKGHLVASKCVEKQVFKPFSGKESGATFDVIQTMKLVEITNDAKTFTVYNTFNSLLMVHSPTGYRNFEQATKKLAKEILDKMCLIVKSGDSSASKSVVNDFPKLVRSLRFTKVAELRKIVDSIGISTCKGSLKNIGMRIFLDALPMVRTSDAAVMMLGALSKGRYKAYRRSWLFSLATMRKPTSNIIEKLSKVGSTLNSPLTVSTIVNTYCKDNHGCFKEVAVLKIVKQITEQLEGDCSFGSEKILIALRAIGNLGAAHDWRVINTCLKNKNIPMGLRVSAAQAIRHLTCDHSGWEKVELMAHFLNKKEDPELRITSYLSLMACPQRPNVLKIIIAQLDVETSQQVGSFVWTHLSNLLETSQVFRKNLQNQLRFIKFKASKYAKKFNLDPRRYSRNFEKSYYNEALNSGVSIEGNVIYSEDSFVPRSTTFNMTGGLFGKSISLFELGLRTTNLDGLVRKGMRTDFRTQKNEGSTMVHFDMSNMADPRRAREEPSIDFYLRLFGNELIYKPNIKPAYYLAAASKMTAENLLKFINDNPISVSHTRMVMEAVISVPTVAGLPLELSLDVASSMDLYSKLNIGTTESELTIKTNFKPKAGLGVVGRMRLDAHCTEIGVEFHGSAFTNTEFGGEFKKTRSEMTLLLNAPQGKQTVIDMKSRMVLVSRRKVREQENMKTDTKTTKQLCSGKLMEAALGLKVCATARYAQISSSNSKGPSFPFTGRNEMSIIMDQVSEILKYIVKGTFIPNPMAPTGVQKFEIELNTEGSSKDRKVLLSFKDGSELPNIDLSLLMRSPMKTIQVTAKGDLSKREMNANLIVDGNSLAKLTSTQTIEEKRVTNINIDIAGKKKYIDLTFSSDNTLSPDEFDHSLDMKTKAAFKSLEVSVSRKLDGDLTKYRFVFGSKVGERSLDISFNNKVKFDANSQLMISNSHGDIAATLKKKEAIVFKYDNKWKMITTPDKVLEEKDALVTEHSISFDQTVQPAKYSKYNVKGGSLIIQHDFQSVSMGSGGMRLKTAGNVPSKKTLNFILSVKNLKFASENSFSGLKKPFIFETYNSFKTKKLDFTQNMDIRYAGWKDMRLGAGLTNKGKRYLFALENVINVDKVLQGASFTAPKYYFNVRSKLTKADDTGTMYEHTGDLAWSRKDSYSTKSSISWGFKDPESHCTSIYQINGKAFKKGKLLGDGFINVCPDIKKRKASIEMSITNGKEENGVIIYFLQDGTFKTDGKDFHVGASTTLTVPGKIDIDFSTNHIYFAPKSDKEVSSNFIFNTRTKTGDQTSYGYKLRLMMKKTGVKSEGTGKLEVQYPLKMYGEVVQTKSKYKVRIMHEPKGNKQRIEQTYHGKSMLWGEAKLDLNTDITFGEEIEFESEHTLKSTMELQKIYVIDGTQKIEGKYKPYQELDAKEKTEIKVTIDEETEKEFEHKTNFEGSFEKDKGEKSFEAEVELKFDSNYPLKSFTYDSKLKGDPTSLSTGYELEWNYKGSDYKSTFDISGAIKDKVCSANTKFVSPLKQMKEFELGGNVNLKKMTAEIDGNYNGKSVKVNGGMTLSNDEATNIYGIPDAKLTITATPNENIKAFKSAGVTLKVFYRAPSIKFFDAKMTLNDNDAFKFAAGFAGMTTGGFEIRSRIPLPKIGRRFDAVLMLEGAKPDIPAPVLEARLFAGKINALLKSTSTASDSDGMQYKISMHLITKKRTIVFKGTALIIDFEKTGFSENKGKITMQKGEDADFDIDSTFEYRFSFKNFLLKTNTDYRFFKKERRFVIDLQNIFELRGKKKIDLELIPNRNSKNKKLSVSINHDGNPLWNFDVKFVASLLVMKSETSGSIRFFYVPDGSRTAESDLVSDAFFACDLKLSSTLKAMKAISIQAAFSNDKKGKLLMSADTKAVKNSLSGSIDATDFPNFVIDLSSGGKTMSITFKKSGKSGRLIASAGGKNIGSADFRYESGKLLKIDATITPPKGKAMEFTFKQKHGAGNWDWRDWSHYSAFSLWTKKNKHIKLEQKITFQYLNDQLNVDASVKSSLKAIENLKGKLKLNAGSTPSSFMSFTFNTFGSKLKAFHDVPNWKNVLKKFITNVMITGPKRQRYVFELKRDSKTKAHLKIQTNVYDKFKLLQYTRKKSESKLTVNAMLKYLSLKTNIVSLVYDSFKPFSSPPKHIYITGEVPKYGKVELRVKAHGKYDFLIKLKLGDYFLNINPKLKAKCCKGPVEVSLNLKITSHLTQFSSCNVQLDHFSSANLMSARHSLSVKLNGRRPFSQKLNYKIGKDKVTGNYKLEYKRYEINAEANYATKTGKYSHNINYGLRNRRSKRFATTADCEPYRFSMDNAKCVLTTTISRQKMVLALVNTASKSKTTKTVRIAWNAMKKQQVRLTMGTDENDPKMIVTNFRLDTPLRNFELIEEIDKTSKASVKVSVRTLHKRTGAVLGHFTIQSSRSMVGKKVRTILRVTSTLLKEEIKFISDVDTSPAISLKSTGALAKEINVRSDMYIGSDSTSKLSLIFTMKVLNDLKKDLRLKLMGGNRYLDLFTRYDLTNPVKTISIGADAKDWTRTLDIVFEEGKQFETTVNTGSTKQTIKVSSERMAQNNGYRTILELDYPEVNGYLKIISQVSRYPLSLLVIVHTDKNKPENKLVVNGRFMNSRNLLFEVKRFKKSSISMETYTQITLDNQNVITKFKWRPGVINDIKGYILRELRPTKLTQYLKNRGSGLREVVKRALEEITAPLKRNVDMGVGQSVGFAITSDFDKIKIVISTMKRFIVKKAKDSAMIDYTMKLIDAGLKKTMKFMGGFMASKPFGSLFDQDKINEIIAAQYKFFYAKLGDKLKGFNEQFVIALLNAAKKRVSTARANFNTWLEATTVKTKAWVKKRRQFLNSIKAGLANRLEAITKAIASNENAMTFMEGMKAFSERMRRVASRLVPKTFIDKLVNSEAVKELQVTMNKLRQLMTWSKQCKGCKKSQSDWNKSMRHLLKGDLKKAFDVYFKPKLTGVKRWDPKKGFINAQVHLPYNIKSLQSVPLAIYAYTRSQAMGITNQLRAGTFQLGKLYLRVNEEFLRYSTGEFIRRQLPPYPAYAYLTGGQHYVTFDGMNIEHAGICSYVLAHDYVDHSFTVMARYAKMGKMVMRKDIIVQTPNAAIFLSRNGLVKLKTKRSGRTTTRFPPMKADDLSVTRIKNRITLSGPKGLTVTCYIKYDVCRISLSEWSHARVNGLLGTNDYERGNDLKGSVSSHVNHWRAGRCSARNLAIIAPKGKAAAGYQLCRSIFDNKRRSLGRCYFKVPPEGYMQSCLNMFKMKGKSGVCSIVKMYIDKCKGAGIQSIRLPFYCVTCGKSRMYWSRFRRPLIPDSRSRNFIFIVEDKPCITSFLPKLRTFIRIMSRRSGGDKYAMIGFGGEGINRDVSTRMLAPAYIKGSYSNFLSALKRMEFKGLATDPALATKALQTSLVLDDDISKQTIIVLLSCSGCKDISNTISYGPMANQLRRRGIRFHYITPHSFGTYGGEDVIGIDNTRIFGRKGKQLSRASSRSSTLKYKRDTCEALARTSGGSVWSIEALGRESSFGISKLKSVIRQAHSRKRRRCTCSGNNAVRCRPVNN